MQHIEGTDNRDQRQPSNNEYTEEHCSSANIGYLFSRVDLIHLCFFCLFYWAWLVSDHSTQVFITLFGQRRRLQGFYCMQKIIYICYCQANSVEKMLSATVRVTYAIMTHMSQLWEIPSMFFIAFTMW